MTGNPLGSPHSANATVRPSFVCKVRNESATEPSVLGVEEAAALIEVRAVIDGDAPDVGFRVAEAEAVPPARPLGRRIQIGEVVELAKLLVGSVDCLLVLTVDRQSEAAKPLLSNAELSLEPRLGEEAEDDAVRALEHDVLGHARGCFRPAELPVERSHAADIPTGERDRAHPCWNAQEAISVRTGVRYRGVIG